MATTPVFHYPGAIEHFVRPGSGGSWYYLGTSVVSPVEEMEDAVLPVMNDLGGRTRKMDSVRDRREAKVTTVLNRFDWTTVRLLRADTIISDTAGFFSEGPSYNGLNTVGRTDWNLLLISTFGPGGSSGSGTPRGRMYFSANPLYFRDTSPMRVTELGITFECIGLFDPASRLFDLYTEDPTDFGSVPTPG